MNSSEEMTHSPAHISWGQEQDTKQSRGATITNTGKKQKKDDAFSCTWPRAYQFCNEPGVAVNT